MNSNSKFDLENEDLVSVLDEISIWSAPFGLRLLDTIKYRNGITALDIGFGTGFPLIELAMRLGRKSTVIGIDPWKAASQRALSKIIALGLKNITIIEGKAEQLPIGDNFLDLIVSNNGINNTDDLPKVFSECFRTMKPRAQFVFSVNLQYTMKEFYDVFLKVLTEHEMNQEVTAIKNHIYAKRKPVAEILKMLNNTGFKINNIFHDSFRFRYSDGTAFLNHYFIKLAFMPEWMKIVSQDKAGLIFSKVETELNTIASASEGLALTVPFAVFNCIKLTD